MLKYLLDTNIAIDVIKRRPSEVMGDFNKNAGRMAISAITLSELSKAPRRVPGLLTDNWIEAIR